MLRLMTIPFPQAVRVCTASEFQLLTAARTDSLKKLKPAALKSKITRTRAYLVKWRGLGIAQARKSKAGQAPDRTAQKVAWFGEALLRFESQLKKLLLPPAPPVKKSAAAKPAKKPVAKLKRVTKENALKSFKSVEARAKFKSAQIAKGGLKGRKRGHILAVGRRNQAKRNSR